MENQFQLTVVVLMTLSWWIRVTLRKSRSKESGQNGKWKSRYSHPSSYDVILFISCSCENGLPGCCVSSSLRGGVRYLYKINITSSMAICISKWSFLQYYKLQPKRYEPTIFGLMNIVADSGINDVEFKPYHIHCGHLCINTRIK